jgi:hypothetical protein
MFKNAVVKLHTGELRHVVVTALSHGAARIELNTRDPLPEHVELIEASLKLRRRARVIWQLDGAAALSFYPA